jgi:hypothetical protein
VNEQVAHGLDGWGLEYYVREEEITRLDTERVEVTVYGRYQYERGKELKEVVRIHSRRTVFG